MFLHNLWSQELEKTLPEQDPTEELLLSNEPKARYYYTTVWKEGRLGII
jgi:hypothetical protein